MNMRNIVRTVLPLLLAAAILVWMYRGLDWAMLAAAVTGEMRWEWMLLSLPFGIAAQVLRALRWRQLLLPLGERPRLTTSVNAIYLSYASSLVVPRVGEVLRCGVLSRYDGCNFSRSLGTVVTERVVDMLVVLVLTAVTFLLQVPLFVNFFTRTGVSLSGFLAQFTSMGWVVTAVCAIVVVLTMWLLARRFHLLTRASSAASDLMQGLLSLRHVRHQWLFWLYSVGIWAAYYLHFYLTFFCFDTTAALAPMAALVAFVIGTFAVLVPTPNGAGPWHFAVKTVLMLYGVASDMGAMFVLIVHTVQTALVALLGLWASAALALTPRRTTSAASGDEALCQQTFT
ncbi:MAG: flippase-like domain-containing protein [Bacteroidaceae bacterium]|nr:flippase-like domain-containing protein [Bacteroidaceae bacterium]